MILAERPRVDPEAAFPDLLVELAPGGPGREGGPRHAWRPSRAWVATARVLRDARGAEHPICPWWPSRRVAVGSGPSAEAARAEAARRAAVVHAYGGPLDGRLLARCRAVARRLEYR